MGIVATYISGADCVLTLLCSCVCKPGYEGDGSFCVEMDPCSGSIPGGCSRYVSVALYTLNQNSANYGCIHFLGLSLANTHIEWLKQQTLSCHSSGHQKYKRGQKDGFLRAAMPLFLVSVCWKFLPSLGLQWRYSDRHLHPQRCSCVHVCIQIPPFLKETSY